MRLHRLPHETTCRLELAALQKTDAVAGRLTFNAAIIETGTESYRPRRFTFLRGGSDSEELSGPGQQ
jgi:hypothetical protein